MPIPSDKAFIEQVRKRHNNRAKYIKIAIAFQIALLFAQGVAAWLLYQQWISTSKTFNVTSVAFWLGITLGGSVGLMISTTLFSTFEGFKSLLFAVRGGNRAERLLLEQHDTLNELIQEITTEPNDA